MSISETKDEILAHLDDATRTLAPGSTSAFTTASIANHCNVSRNLASQYLNELVRAGLVVKVNARPVIFLHRRSLERYLQATQRFREGHRLRLKPFHLRRAAEGRN